MKLLITLTFLLGVALMACDAPEDITAKQVIQAIDENDQRKEAEELLAEFLPAAEATVKAREQQA